MKISAISKSTQPQPKVVEATSALSEVNMSPSALAQFAKDADKYGVRAGFDLLMQRGRSAAPNAKLDGVLVAKQLKGGVECILGIHRDPVFGPIAMFGLGGIFVEILQDVVLHRCPFGVDVAEDMIRSIKGAPLLLGARGRKPVGLKALAKMLSQLSAFAVAAGPRLQSIDLNPVLAMPEGQGAYAVDAVIEVTN